MMCLSTALWAQFRIDIQGGIAQPQGNAFENSKGIGLGYSIGVMYVPGVLDDQLSFGLVKDGNILLSAGGKWGELGIDLSASKLGFAGAKARFDLDNPGGPRPYGAISVGVGSIDGSYIYKKRNPDDPSIEEFAKGNIKTSKFMVKPEVGVAFGWFTMGVGWLLPTSFTDSSNHHKMRAGAIQYNIGFRITID